MKIHAMPQGSAEWVAVRLGKLTASDAQVIYAKGKGNTESVQRRNLRLVLALERINGCAVSSFRKSWAMEQGTENEPEARRRYQALTGEWLDETGFCEHDTLAAGASVDGHTPDFTGLAEFKCPEPAAHFEFLSTGVIPARYVDQVTHQLWITGAEWCDFVSFNADFAPRLQLKIARVERRLLDLDAHEKKVREFLDEVQRQVEEINSIAGVVDVCV